MTNHARGSSLLQTRRSHIHRHLHDQRRNIHHVHHPRDIQDHAPSTTIHEDIEIRQYPDLDHPEHPVVTQVVQTVSVVQYVDGNGDTIDVSTVYSPPVTQVVDQLTGVTIERASGSVVPTVPVPVPSSPPSDDTAAPTSSSPLSQEATPPLTSSLSSSSAFPSLSAATNSSTSSFVPHFNNSTQASHSLFANSTRTTSSMSTPFFYSLTSSSSFKSSSTSDDDRFTAFGGGSSSTTEPTLAATASTTASSGSGSSQSTPTSTVVGGVVGGVAGLALLVLGALLLMRWKRRQNGVRLLGDGDAPTTSRGLGGPSGPGGPFGTFAEASAGGGGGGSGGGSGGSSGGAMAERGLPFAIPASLAALSGYKRSSQATSAGGTDSSERGFARISGRKLPSVLQHGGDGFSDPHDSMLSGQSFYRDSHGFWGGDGSPRFALGSPMRPESGIPVMQPGPVRTPITEQGPIFEHPSPGRNSPGLRSPASLDPLGRTHISQDGSRGSGSRFTENI